MGDSLVVLADCDGTEPFLIHVDKQDLHFHPKELGGIPEEPESLAPLALVVDVVGLQVWVDVSCFVHWESGRPMTNF